MSLTGTSFLCRLSGNKITTVQDFSSKYAVINRIDGVQAIDTPEFPLEWMGSDGYGIKH